MTFAIGAKVRLRRFQPADLDAFLAYRNDPEVARYQSWPTMTRDQARGFISAMHELPGPMVQGEWTQIAVADPATDALYGDMGLYLDAEGREAELGISLAQTAQGQGRATDAFNLAVDLVWAHSDADKVWGIADVQNLPSLRMLERAGFAVDRTETTDGVTERFTYRLRP